MYETKFTERVPNKAEERAKITAKAYNAIRFDENGKILPFASESLVRIIGLVGNIDRPFNEVGDEKKQLVDQLQALQNAFQMANDYMKSHNGNFPSEDRVSIPHVKGTLVHSSTTMLQFFSDTSEYGAMRWILGQVMRSAEPLVNGGNETKIRNALITAVNNFTDAIQFLSKNPTYAESVTVTSPAWATTIAG